MRQERQFSVRGQITDPTTGEADPAIGTVTETADTRLEAIKIARKFHASGYIVAILDSDEQIVDEDASDGTWISDRCSGLPACSGGSTR